MIRIVDRWKAVVAGVAGALAMEIVTYVLKGVGVPAVDLVAEVSSVVGASSELLAFGAGLVGHAAVGIAWALFYAYFFWARFPWPRPLQGLAFAMIPALLTIAIVYPQFRLMQLHSDIAHVSSNDFLHLSALSIATVFIIHAAYGLTVGILYRHPVGYPVGDRPSPPAPRRELRRTEGRGRGNPTGFIFATGIECSYPTIEHGRWRRDELLSTRHYRYWQRDFDLCRQIGVSHLRYGPPLHLVFTGAGRFDWSWCDEQMAELERHGPEPIVDLCHFGIPDWLGSLQNPDLPKALAEYAGAFAKRYPWVRFYTPVNEMYVCARMSALEGNWNEQEQDDRAFVRAAVHLASASNAMCRAIIKVRPDAILVNSESSEFTQPCCPDPDIVARANLENERRFLPLDLIFAHPLSETMKKHLRGNGVSDSELAGFMDGEVPRRSVLGIDYYEWNERLIESDGSVRALGELFGWYVIANQYYDRYRRPIMYTETNRTSGDASRWLWRQWHNVQLLRESGVPLIGFTWYSLTDQVDWSIGLSKSLGKVFPVGLFDLNRDVRTVGLAYRQLIDMFSSDPDLRHCKDLMELMS